jgi:hypothetical protein
MQPQATPKATVTIERGTRALSAIRPQPRDTSLAGMFGQKVDNDLVNLGCFSGQLQFQHMQFQRQRQAVTSRSRATAF